MPIRESQRARYPADWPEISRRIREDRAGNRCECFGDCGRDHEDESVQTPHGQYDLLPALPVGFTPPPYVEARCEAMNGQPHPVTGSTVVLTTAHLNHKPEDCRDDNLLAMCQRCHLAYDAGHHAQTRAETRRAAQATAMQPLFELPEGTPTDA